jgi:hypothetical protein
VLGSIGVDPSSVRGYPTAVTPIVRVGHLVRKKLRRRTFERLLLELLILENKSKLAKKSLSC